MNLTQRQKDALNRAMAEACGWTQSEQFPETFYPPGRDKKHGGTLAPRYCTDRNALPEIWEAVEKAGNRLKFMSPLLALLDLDYGGDYNGWYFATAEPHLHVIAALCALNRWTPDLEAIMQETDA